VCSIGMCSSHSIRVSTLNVKNDTLGPDATESMPRALEMVPFHPRLMPARLEKLVMVMFGGNWDMEM
jgi:hypothetical protein